jgi:hypothetical protein
LEIPYAGTIEVKAIFVSMAELKTEIEESIDLGLYSFRMPEVEIPKNIELWDYNDLISKLNEHHVPTAYQELLKKMHSAIII